MGGGKTSSLHVLRFDMQTQPPQEPQNLGDSHAPWSARLCRNVPPAGSKWEAEVTGKYRGSLYPQIRRGPRYSSIAHSSSVSHFNLAGGTVKAVPTRPCVEDASRRSSHGDFEWLSPLVTLDLANLNTRNLLVAMGPPKYSFVPKAMIFNRPIRTLKYCLLSV